ncbi:helix-turn-helix domain-containing protein [Magnetospira thiophila]
MTSEFGDTTHAGPHPIDRSVGQRLKERRMELRISRKALARDVGVSPQQIAKYEQGFTRVSASVLYSLSKALSLPVADFFSDVTPELIDLPPRTTAEMDRELKAFLLVYMQIADPRVRRSLLDVIRSMGIMNS